MSDLKSEIGDLKSDAAPLVSVDEHEQGWKDVEVEFRSGRKAVWRLKAPPARAARMAFTEMLHDRDASALTRLALPDDVAESALDSLTLDSLGAVEEIAVSFAFGEKQKKTLAAAARAIAMAMAVSARSSPPNSGSSAADSATPKSADGASPSSGSTSTNSIESCSTKPISTP